MIEKIYYRTLCTPEHIAEWRSKNFYSYHHATPGLWFDAYFKSGCREPSCFPLRFVEGIINVEYTERSRDQFLQCAAKYGSVEWPAECLKYSSELNGVCAFDNPNDVYEYGRASAAAESGGDVYVVFKGIEICQLPEDNGYVAKVLHIIHGEMNSNEFKRLFLPQLI